ncbi:MAG TPA: type II toxin-antitoxin system VapB family antitoxin, partial [Steroidobacteraceae bacterium]|nr:type II toxin-antitoxin system VapB family antitoxin [Steroidobacteraceae bacterium]
SDAIAMKTHVDVDGRVLEEVMRMGNFASKKTAINTTLAEYLLKLKRLDLLAMRGNVPWVGDLDALRADRRDRR